MPQNLISAHIHVNAISRSAGRSVVAAAAYQSGSALTDERLDRVWDYGRKKGVQASEIILPSGLSNLAVELTKERLWNLAERAEKRSNSCVGREYEISLPSSMTPAQRIELGQLLGRYLADRRGGAADVSWHDRRTGHNENYHIHILTTTREAAINNTGDFELGRKCVQELSPQDRRKLGLKNRENDLRETRAELCKIINDACDAAGVLERYTEKSFWERGLNLEPTKHLGPEIARLERSGVKTEKGDMNRRIQKRNAEILALDAELAAAEIAKAKLLKKKAEEESALAASQARAKKEALAASEARAEEEIRAAQAAAGIDISEFSEDQIILAAAAASLSNSLTRFESTSEYEGFTHGGLAYGPGRRFFPDGRVLVIDWFEGLPHGAGHYIYPDGSSATTRFQHGQCVHLGPPEFDSPPPAEIPSRIAPPPRLAPPAKKPAPPRHKYRDRGWGP